jgi:ribonuclease-3
VSSSEFQQILSYQFRYPELLKRALTHSSFNGNVEEYQEENNEKLEFLGDAFLDAVVSEWLIREHQEMKEGDFSKTRALIVCEKSLAKIALQLGIPPFIRMSRGEELTGGRDRPSILADTVEAVIGAIYLDGGYDAVRDFILNSFRETFREALQGGGKVDFKTQLQELLQQRGTVEIRYVVVKEEGQPHDKTFYVNLLVDGSLAGSGQGKSKKQAEQNAAEDGLKRGVGFVF